MAAKAKDLDALLNRLCAALRADEPAPAAFDQAAARVWNRLAESAPSLSAQPGAAAVTAIPAAVPADLPAAPPTLLGGALLRGCEDIQAWLRAAGRERRLTPAQQLLLEDHLHDCVACRRAWTDLQLPASSASAPLPRPAAWGRARFSRLGWAAVGAVAILALAVVAYFRLAPMAGEAQVLAASGPLYSLAADGGLRPLAAHRIAFGQVVRTAPNTDALLRLADTTQIEVRGQSEFSLAAARRGTTLDLARGAVIIQAARQRAGRRLFVATRGALVSVRGTVFSVSEGLRGARIAVLSGQVQVDRAGRQTLLQPGDQFATSADLAAAPLRDAFDWSRDSSHYLALLASISALRRDLQQVPYPGLRYSSSLLAFVPADTVFYAALPNLSGTLAQSFQVFQEHLAQDPALRAWWESRHANASDAVASAVRQLQQLGADLGDEVAVAAEAGLEGPQAPLMLAQVTNPQDFRYRLEQINASGVAPSSAAPPAGGAAGRAARLPRIALLSDPLAGAPPAHADLYVWLDNGLMAASPQLDPLRRLAARMRQNAGGFAQTPFYNHIVAAYQQGVSLLVAADLRRIVAAAQIHGPNRSELFRRLGVANLDYLIAEQQIGPHGTADRAELSFSDTRTGIASWLAAPAPMGALNYISPNPQAVVAAQLKQPSAILDDLFGLLASQDPHFDAQLERWRAEHGVALRDSLAAPLGSEFAFALDGPLLPMPAWKAIVEVNDPARLQQGIQQLVAALSHDVMLRGRPALQLDQTQEGGQLYYRLSTPGTPSELDYTFSGGYWIAAAGRGLVAEALRYHDSDYNLLHSQQFQAALPPDRQVNCSALMYQNLAPAMQTLFGLPGVQRMSPQQQQSLRDLGAQAPTAACAYADRDNISFAMNGPNGPLGFSLEKLLGVPNGFDLRNLMDSALHGGNGK